MTLVLRWEVARLPKKLGPAIHQVRARLNAKNFKFYA